MILHDVAIDGYEQLQHVLIRDGVISIITKDKNAIPTGKDEVIALNGARLLPGFINSHDHLEFNCYPSLGNRTYSNYREWGPAIQTAYADTIRQVQQIPEPLRIAWGMYKNLFNGFTTVVNHGKKINVGDELISVIQQGDALHSTAFEKNWKLKLNNPFRKGPVVIHAGEGTDARATDEIDELIRSNWFRKKIIAVHGVAMNKEQAGSFAGLVWCPASNYFFLGRTAVIDELKHHTRIVFGTDSTLTSSWDCQDHYRQVKQSGMVTGQECINLLTTSPADLWKLNDRGTIAVGKTADLLVIKPDTEIFNIDISAIWLVIHRGKTRLADVSATGPGIETGLSFSQVRIGNSEKKVQGRPLEIAEEIKKYYPSLYNPFLESYA